MRSRDLATLREEVGALEEVASRARSEAQAALSAVIAPETIARSEASVYLIVVDGRARATAFVIDRENGILATAAHSAKVLALDDEDAPVYLLNRATQKRIPITGKRLHSGYGAFRALVEEYQPIRNNSSIYRPEVAALRDLAFDAALLTVDPIDPETGANMLGPDLPIASEETLLALSAGAPIAVIGYPYDTLDDGFSPDAAIPRIERGVIAAMTPPLDTAQRERDPVVANLIIHRLSTAGGSSGSPVLNSDGEVVGIHTHGIESRSSNADGAAQRADVLHDLLIEGRDDARLADVFFPAWRETLSFWSRAMDALPWSFFMEHARPGQSPAPLVAEIDYDAEKPFESDIQTLNFEAVAETWSVAADISRDDTAPVSGEDGFVIREPGEFAELRFTVDRARPTVLFAFDYSLRSRRGFCPLTSYWRTESQTRLQVARDRASFELFLPAAEDTVEAYQVVLRRDPKCDPISNEFFAGEIIWGADKEEIVAAHSDVKGIAFPATGAGAAQKASFRVSAERFLRCDIFREKAADFCAEPEFIELEPR